MFPKLNGWVSSLPYISVIITSYNEIQCLPCLLRSIQNQTFTDYEIIIVEGSVNPEIDTIAKNYDAKVVRENYRNIGKATNLGAKTAHSDILVFTHADCRMADKDLLSKIAANFLNDPLLMSCSGPTIEDCDSPMTQFHYTEYHVARKVFSILPHPLKRYRPPANLIVIRQSFLRFIGWFPEVLVDEDGALGIKIDAYNRKYRFHVKYDMGLRMVHLTRRFKENKLRAHAFYLMFIIPNFFSFMRPLFRSILHEREMDFLSRPMKIGSQ